MSTAQRSQLLTFAFALGLMFLLSQPWQPYPGDFAVKGGGILLLAAYAFTSRSPLRIYLGVALIFSALGDVLLALQMFVPGLVSFLVAHLIYIAMFVAFIRTVGEYRKERRLHAAFLAAVAFTYLMWLWPSLNDLRIPVAAYMAVIAVMGCAALLAPLRSPLAAIGAVSFILSDSTIALNKFKMPFDAADPLIWITYFAAQVFIVMGILSETKDTVTEDKTPWQETLRQNLGDAGFDLLHWFDVQAINDHGFGGAPLEDYKRTRTRALLVANSAALWPSFEEALRKEPGLLTTKDPLYAYVEGAVRRAAKAAAIPVDYRIHWAHTEGEDLIAIQKIADASGFAKQGPMGLNIHEEFGPWIGLRAVIVFDLDGMDTQVENTAPPCDTCDKPCLAPLEIAMKETQSLTSGQVEAKWQSWLAVRDACPIGKSHRYSEDQIRYHYTKDRAVLQKMDKGSP